MTLKNQSTDAILLGKLLLNLLSPGMVEIRAYGDPIDFAVQALYDLHANRKASLLQLLDQGLGIIFITEGPRLDQIAGGNGGLSCIGRRNLWLCDRGGRRSHHLFWRFLRNDGFFTGVSTTWATGGAADFAGLVVSGFLTCGLGRSPLSVATLAGGTSAMGCCNLGVNAGLG